jgi:hypothetical protein
VAANLFQDAEESEAATKFWETPSGQDVMPDLWMLRYENFDPPKEPNNETKEKIGLSLFDFKCRKRNRGNICDV